MSNNMLVVQFHIQKARLHKHSVIEQPFSFGLARQKT